MTTDRIAPSSASLQIPSAGGGRRKKRRGFLTPQEIEARRRNAKKSTGPRTAAGKQRSALNSLKRGLIPPWMEAKMVVQGDDPRDFRRLHRDLISALDARDADLRHLLAALTALWWEKLLLLQMRPFGPLEGFAIRKVDEMIEAKLDSLAYALSFRSRKWRHRLRKMLGGEIASLRALRVGIEKKLPGFAEALAAANTAKQGFPSGKIRDPLLRPGGQVTC